MVALLEHALSGRPDDLRDRDGFAAARPVEHNPETRVGGVGEEARQPDREGDQHGGGGDRAAAGGSGHWPGGIGGDRLLSFRHGGAFGGRASSGPLATNEDGT